MRKCSGILMVCQNLKERLMHSVVVKEISKEELEGELKSGAAKIWVDGFTMLVGVCTEYFI